MYKAINITLYEEQEIYNHIKTMDPDLEWTKIKTSII
jgi:hypothetical protein